MVKLQEVWQYVIEISGSSNGGIEHDDDIEIDIEYLVDDTGIALYQHYYITLDDMIIRYYSAEDVEEYYKSYITNHS